MARKKCSIIGEITDFDYHGNWGDFVSARFVKAFLETLTEHDEAEIEINSPGGSVIQGIEIANAIKNCKAKVVAHVTGMAASMASVIMCAADEIELDEASFVMIHDPWSYAAGNAEELRKQASILDQMKTVIMSFYRGKFKKCGEDEISALMSDETWYTANEAAEMGLECSVISSDFRAAASVVGHTFAKMPEGAAKFMTAKEITEEGKAEIDAARQAAHAAVTTVPTATAEAPVAEDWEARYKGASKKINELQAKLDKAMLDSVDYGAVVADRDKLKDRVADLEATAVGCANALNDFEDQVKKAGFEDLAALIGAVSGLKSDLEKRDQDLAECRQQLEHMKETRDLLTGSVLTPGNGSAKFADFAQAVDALGFVEACHKYPELRKSYRNKK